MTNRVDTNLKQWQVVSKIKTSAYSISALESSTAYCNTGATGAVVLSLPKAVPGLGPYYFLVTAAFALTVTPKSTDTIRGLALGASLSSAVVGTLYKLLCITPNFWEQI